MRKNSIKNTRINSEVQRELSSGSQVLQGVYQRVRQREAAKDTIQGLKSAVGFVRTQLAKRINLRNTPEITFILDQSIEYGVHMTRLIDEVTENLRDSESGDEEENE